MEITLGIPFEGIYVPTTPARFALRISAGVSSGERYRVIKYWTVGSIFSRVALYSKACSVVVIGGLRFGFCGRE